MKNRFKKGSILVLTLLTLLVLMMYAMTLLTMNKQNLNYSRLSNAHINAQMMSQAGLNHLLNILTYNQEIGQDPDDPPITYEHNGASYTITFKSTDEFHSVNNLGNGAEAATKNFENQPVHGNTADIVVIGKYQIGQDTYSTHYINVILRRDFDFDMSLSSEGKITLDGNTSIYGIENMLTKDLQIGGGIHSNFDTGGDKVSIKKSRADTTFYLGNQAVITCVGNQEGLNAYNPQEGRSAKILPTYSVKDIVQKKADLSPPPGLSDEGGHNYVVDGVFNVIDEHYVNGNLTINGDLNLCEGTLFVDGHLTVNGGVKGFGGLYVAGKIDISGGNVSLVSNQRNAAAVFADGNVTIEGLDTQSPLAEITLADNELNDKYQDFLVKYQALLDFLQSKDTTGTWRYDLILNNYGDIHRDIRYYFVDGVKESINSTNINTLDPDRAAVACIYWAIHQLGLRRDFSMSADLDCWADDDTEGDPDGNDPVATFVNPIADPDGYRMPAHKDAIIPGLIMNLEATYSIPSGKGCGGRHHHGGHGGGGHQDPASEDTGRYLQGLYELAYLFRTNHTYDGCYFHDEGIPLESRSLTHLAWYTVNDRGVFGKRDVGLITPQQFLDIAKDVILTDNLLGANYGDKSYFQGIIYSNGNVDISESVDIYGAIVSQGNVRLDDASVVYVKEFMKMWGSTAPLSIVKYRDL